MRMWVVAVRLIRQLLRDRRTLAMLFAAPIVILLLMSVVFSTSNLNIRLAVVNLPQEQLKLLQEIPNLDVYQVTQSIGTRELKDNQVDAVLKWKTAPSTGSSLGATGSSQNQAPTEPVDMGAAVLTLEGSEPSVTAQTMARIRSFQESLTKAVQNRNTASPAGVSQNAGFTLEVRYLHGGSDLTTLDYFAPVLIGFFIFLFVFILSGVSFLRERTTGTLERALVTPLRRGEMVVGYLIGFGVFAVLQTLVIQMVAIYGLQVTHAGSLWVVSILNLLLAVVALSLGMLLSAFARTELQMLQFIPLVIVPQIFLSGIFNFRGMPHWLVLLSKVFPLTYGAQALRGVMIRGAGFAAIWSDAAVLAGYAAVFLLLTGLVLRKHAAH